MAEYLNINPDNPQPRKIEEVVETLRRGGLVIYPTDTYYGIGCDLYNQSAVKKLCQWKGLNPKKMNLSFICYDLSDITNYVKSIDTPVFRVLKKALPGPFTFIMDASSKVPKIVGVKKKQVGIRVPDNNIPREIVSALGNPIISSSLKKSDDIIEYPTDPELILEDFGGMVDMVIDGGAGHTEGSTVVDCTSGDFEVLRDGLGDIELYL